MPAASEALPDTSRIGLPKPAMDLQGVGEEVPEQVGSEIKG